MKSEKYWEVAADGPVAVQMDPDELRASDSWIMFHNFQGRLIFENYCRAMLCLQEMRAQMAVVTPFQSSETN